MRVWVWCFLAGLAVGHALPGFSAQSKGNDGQAGATSARSSVPGPATAPDTAMTDEEKANQLSDQIGKLMVKCVNLLTAQDPLSLDFCKQQRDLAEQYPAQQRMVDRVLAHDEYGIALAAFDHKQEALGEFNQEIRLLPKAAKPGTLEWSTAYWHRAMIHSQMNETKLADRDYRAAEESFRREQREKGAQHPDRKMRVVLRQHAALLQKMGETTASQKLLQEAAK
ncbi:MAG TPA: hypothetical protein VGR96_07510 [Acidobacteriaceae bacterium]|nr:hypothetical protein [Acidobacteriaceae bacterium]